MWDVYSEQILYNDCLMLHAAFKGNMLAINQETHSIFVIYVL